jgi:hypothetical protein
MSMLELAIEAIGWIGAGLILGAYGLLTAGKLTAQSLAYQGMNVVGAAGFIVNGWWHDALPSTVLNIIWMGIGAVALWRMQSNKGSSTSAT